MALNLLRRFKNFNKVPNLYGLAQSKFSVRSYSIYGKEGTSSRLLTPLGGQHYLIKRHQLVKIRLREDASSKKYGVLWAVEQSTNVVLVFLIPAIFLMENKELEMTLGALVMLHNYWSFHTIYGDYLRSHNVGKVIPKLANLLLLVVSLATLTGLYQLIYDDIGIANTVKKFWSIKGNDAQKAQKVAHKQRKWYEYKKGD